jgi:hypothetical protein
MIGYTSNNMMLGSEKYTMATMVYHPNGDFVAED